MVFAATVSSLIELPRQVKYKKAKARRRDRINILRLILKIFFTLLKLKIFFEFNSNLVILLKAQNVQNKKIIVVNIAATSVPKATPKTFKLKYKTKTKLKIIFAIE